MVTVKFQQSEFNKTYQRFNATLDGLWLLDGSYLNVARNETNIFWPHEPQLDLMELLRISTAVYVGKNMIKVKNEFTILSTSASET